MIDYYFIKKEMQTSLFFEDREIYLPFASEIILYEQD